MLASQEGLCSIGLVIISLNQNSAMSFVYPRTMKLKTKTTYLKISSSIWLPQLKGKSAVQKRICLLLRPHSGIITLHQTGKRKANQWLQFPHF